MKQDSTKTAVVDKTYHWRPITNDTPRGQKLQLINRRYGVAQYATLGTADQWYTHWAPLPTFEAEVPQETSEDLLAGSRWVLAQWMLSIWNPDLMAFLRSAKRQRQMRLYYRTKGIVLHDQALTNNSIETRIP